MEAVPPQMPQPADPRYWKSQAKRRRLGLMLADRAAGLLNLQRNQEATRRLVRKMQDGTLGQPDANGEATEAGDVDGIRVGDEYHWHNQPQTTNTENRPTPPARDTLTRLLTAALAGAGLAGGAAYVADKLSGDKEPPPAAVQPADGDLRYGLEIVRPEE
jgi:hypothetical protein